MPTTLISTITFTPSGTIVPSVTAGYCDPGDGCGVQCGTCQWTQNGMPGLSFNCCTVGNCYGGLVPQTVPIKQLLNGSSVAPWVRIRFIGGTQAQEDSTEITTGNISQPGNVTNPATNNQCNAAIKSFQYSWGSIGEGNKCKVTIVDELGASFKNWMDRLVKNPETASQNTNQGVYKMKVSWGWVITGGNGCPADGSATTSCGAANSTSIICSPDCYFLPNTITVNMQNNGKFIYEIEGVDLLLRGAENPSQRIYGTAVCGMHLKDACTFLGQTSIPPFNVSLYQINENDPDGPPLPLQFVPNMNVGEANPANCLENNFVGPPAPSTPQDYVNKGPKRTWRCQAYNPLSVIQSWFREYGVLAANPTNIPGVSGRGFTFNYDPTYRDPNAPVGPKPAIGNFQIWANALPTGPNQIPDIQKRIKALYIVGGGRCSPVFGFTPQIKWNFTAAARIGGLSSTSTGNQKPASANDQSTGLPGNGGARLTPSIPTEIQGEAGNADKVINSVAAQRQANLLCHSIEAELRVQGDPSDWLCTPLKAYGRCVSLVVINPFSLDSAAGAIAGCPTWRIGGVNGQTCTATSGGTLPLCMSSCNEILTNKAWFIRGVDHQIKEGSYITTLKIILFAPGGDTYATVANDGVVQAVPLGTAAGGYALCGNDGTSPGTFAPGWQMPDGTDPQLAGTGESDDPACTV